MNDEQYMLLISGMATIIGLLGSQLRGTPSMAAKADESIKEWTKAANKYLNPIDGSPEGS